jgi:beta-aspartyl-peptidase (threonine type)
MAGSPHVLMIGAGAEAFAAEHGLEIVDPAYFHTQARWDQLQKARSEERILLDHDAGPALAQPKDEKRGTVGAVALDRQGNLAAGTSTGGLTNKRWGRVGDSPIVGAGTWADNRTVAVSATGTGEMFIRSAAAHDVAARVQFAGASPGDAADQTLAEIAAIAGDGGLIVLDAHGNHAERFNTSGMYRGSIGNDGVPYVAIYREEDRALSASPPSQP